MSYYTKSRHELVDFIEYPPMCVLEIGCGAGDFGQLLKRRFNSFVVGVEIETSIANLAREKLDLVYDKCFEELVAENAFEHEFDLIVLNDVIEHMQDPLNFLKLLEKVASSNGYCLCSIPNFIYVDNLFEIVTKRDFKYRDSGILDKTHLRFFTKKSIIRIFDSAGYVETNVTPLNYNRSLKWRIFSAVTFGLFSDFLVFQYAVVAKFK